MVLAGWPGASLWLSNDTYARAKGTEMIGVIGAGERTSEDGQVGSTTEHFESARAVFSAIRRSRDNGVTWTVDEPFWQLTPQMAASPYGYGQNSVNGLVLDARRDVLIRFIGSAFNFGPCYFGAGSPTYRNNRLFYDVSRDGGRTWGKMRPVVCEGYRDAARTGKYFWMDWAPGVLWGSGIVFFDQPSRLWLDDGTLLLGLYRVGLDCRDGWAALRARWKDEAQDLLAFEAPEFNGIGPEVSTKGISEPDFVRLRDGRLFAVLRCAGNPATGTHARRYYALSEDGGKTWTPPQELRFDDGTRINVPESISKVVRSAKTGKVYWVGNIADQPAYECAPRNKIQIAELDESRPALVRDSVTILDQAPLDSGISFSNFSFYEERGTADLVVVMPWWHPGDAVSNGYRYTIGLGEEPSA
jgi:hypothetical protein